MAPSSIFLWISRRCSTPVSLINSLQQRRRSVSKMASPWLMLSPTIEPNQNKRAYNFYSIAQNKVITVSSEYDDKGFMISDVEESTVCLGSSHGWLALFYPSNLDLFLFNPLSRRHVKLPSLYSLPVNPELLRERGFVKKLIISSSPHEEDCRALMSFDYSQRLAFCCPGSREAEAVWTTIGGDEYLERDEDYTDFVYSTTHKLFYCTRAHNLKVLDLRNPSFPEYIPRDDTRMDVFPCASRSDEELINKIIGYPLWFLVPYSGDIFLVHQFAFDCVDPVDGSIVDYTDEGGYENFPYKTFDFDVYRYDEEKQELIYLNCETDTLNDLAFFIGGSNHSFALSAREFPELKPNSIYYTDSILDLRFKEAKPYGGHDVGIFNYKDKSLSSCYYPCDAQSIRRTEPTPVWFTPSPN